MQSSDSPDSKNQRQPQQESPPASAEGSGQSVQNNHHRYPEMRRKTPPPPQPWFAMHQYHPAAVVMQVPHQQQFPAPQHYYGMQFMGYPRHQQWSQRTGRRRGANDGESNRTIWVGDLDHWMDENYLHSCFASAGEIASIKVIRNKQSGLSEGYGFVEFFSHAVAEKVLEKCTGITMPNAEQPFRLNWGTFSTSDKPPESDSDLSIFIGDLDADVTDGLLHETFASKYPSVKASKVVLDVHTGRSKGPMRIAAATPRKIQNLPQGGYLSNGSPARGFQSDGETTNTTIFVGGLDPVVNDEVLRDSFAPYGEIVSVKIPMKKGCGFVQFANRSDAEEAMQKLNGTTIRKQIVRLSWGRSLAMKQSRAHAGNHWDPTYYARQVYNGYRYGYGLPPSYDPVLYGSVYAPYPAMFGGHQQQVS
ncbi:hypothetical protein MLD38_002073 [Melastoma candidum]|uniref:Uncharacterized protein n=1 Tax=Melastoma candidum TaxID=119954 RepID=A0ACB9SFQ2_9MYRT|nr:hypothetical protein MLD38_002073 [Melastoma candidum]